MEFYDFPYMGNVIIPTDSYFSEEMKPPTSGVLQKPRILQADIGRYR